MSGGTFTSQNKVRPGAYINFKGVVKPSSSLGTRGIMTMPVPMSWGAPVTELLSTDLLDGKSIAKIGYDATDVESLIYRLALANCYKVIVFRLDAGGTAASGAIGDLDLDAKYAGIVGNLISVAVIVNGSNFDVVTYYNGAQKDKQTVPTAAELVDNDWVNFSYTTAVLTANAGTSLTGGLNGSVSDANYTTYKDTIVSYQWNVMAIPQDVTGGTVNALIATFIKDLRDNAGRKVQAVLFDIDEDYEGIISVDQGFKTETEEVVPEVFSAYVGGLTAGAGAAESNTYKVIEGAIEITYPNGVTPYTNDDIIAKLKAGKFVISTLLNGSIVVEQDINTLHTFIGDKPYDFSKNRVIRTLDEINNGVNIKWAETYAGKVSNVESGRTLFKGDIIGFMLQLESIEAITEFDSSTDIEILAGQDIDAVVANLAVKPVDAMEKLYMTVNVGR